MFVEIPLVPSGIYNKISILFEVSAKSMKNFSKVISFSVGLDNQEKVNLSNIILKLRSSLFGLTVAISNVRSLLHCEALIILGEAKAEWPRFI